MSDNLQSYRNSILGIQKSPNFASFYRFDKYRTSLMRENCDLLYSYKSEMLEIYDQKSPFGQFVSHLNLDAIALSSRLTSAVISTMLSTDGLCLPPARENWRG
jgi:hypothetical protein